MPCSLNTKFYLLISLFLISTCNCFSQSCDELKHKAEQLYEQGKIADAIKIAESSLENCKKETGNESTSYATLLYSIAFYYSKIFNYEKTEFFLVKALAIDKKILGEYNAEYASSLNNLAWIYLRIGNYTKAEELFKQVLAIRKKVLGEDHKDYARTLNNLSELYYDMGNYAKAEPLCVQAMKIRKKVLGEFDKDYGISVNNLALIYCKMSNYAKAEPLHIQALDIIKKVQGKEHPVYAIALISLASLYSNMGNYAKAEPLNIQALDIIKKALGEEDSDYALSLNSLALLYKDMGNYAKAEPLFIKALAIRKRLVGENHIEYAVSLNNLALLYNDIGEFTKAEQFYIQALNIIKNVLGENNPQYVTSLNNIAALYNDMGNEYKAEQLYIQSIDIIKKILGEEHSYYTTSLLNLALLHFKSGNYNKAEPLFEQELGIINKNWKSYFSFLSENESSVFLEQNLFVMEIPLSFLFVSHNAGLITYLLDFNLMIKNLLISNNNFLEEAASKNLDTRVSNQWEQYKTLRLQISKKLQKSISDQDNLNILKEEAEVLEKKLMQKLPEFLNSITNNKLTWRDIKSKLKPDELAVDFVSFRYYDKHWTDTTMYAAFLIRSDWTEPKFVNLFREEELSVLFENANNSLGINELYNSNNSLYNLIWHPMDSLLTGVKKVYVSPSGLINRVSLSAIPVPEGGHLNDRYDIQVMGNLRVLAEKKSITSTPSTSILFGGIDYDNEPMVTTTTTGNNFGLMDSTLRSLRGGKWTNLVGTAEEISHIQKIYSTNGITNRVYSKNNASEEIFKSIGNGNNPTPSILHIATHGFAFSTLENRPNNSDKLMQLSTGPDKSNVFKLTTDPLTRAGLVLAGGNKVWSTGDTYPNKEDGILTAREISNMNLRACTLATLSACETGLGEIKGSEGVFGLQRAFKIAGVQHLIVSLWKVPDRETSEFMETFYNNWLTNKIPLREAFRKTQQLMSKKYKPYQWAAFVLVE